MRSGVRRGTLIALGLSALLLGALAGCAQAPVHSVLAPTPAVSASGASRGASVAALPRVELRLELDDDFIRPLRSLLPEHPIDEKEVVAMLPGALGHEWKAALGEFDRYEVRRAKAPDSAAWTGQPAKQVERVIERLRAAGATGGKTPTSPGATPFAAALLQARLARILISRSAGPGDRARGQALEADLGGRFEQAASQAPLESEARSLAFYEGARAYERAGRDVDAALLWDSLARTGAPDRRAEALTRLGLLLLDGPRDALDRAEASLTAALEDPGAMDPPVRAAATHGRMLAVYRLRRWGEVMQDASRYLELPATQGAPTIGTEGALRLAVDAAERFDAGDPLALPSISPRVAQDIALRLAWRAVRRADLSRATGLAQAALRRAPDALHAPNALRTLIAVAARSGDASASAELSQRLSTEYGPTSSWARVQREQRDRTGWPSEQVIADASRPAAPAAPETATEQVEAMTRALVRLCVEPVWWRARQPAAREASLELVALVTPGLPLVVTANHAPGQDALAGAVECVQRLGPAFLARTPASVHAAVRF